MNPTLTVPSPPVASPAVGPANATAAVPQLGWRKIVLLSAGAVAAFHLAYAAPALSFLTVVYLFCLFELSAISTSRRAFYIGLAIGVAVCAPRMDFLWLIFKMAAIPLWLVIALWHGLFLVLARQARQHCRPVLVVLLVPLLWLGLEYFRSEIYFLKFSWFNAGYAFAGNLPNAPLASLGVYGIGWFLMTLAVVVAQLPRNKALASGLGALLALGIITNSALISPPSPAPTNSKGPFVAGIQLEFPIESELPAYLDKVLQKYPAADIVVLSEYTLDGPPPEPLKNWCRQHAKHLVVGGKDPVPNNQFYNTAFVVGPTGEVIFKQVKNVPIQFFADGLPAPERTLWNSPWGRIGLAVCYDLNYRRVIDDFIRLGAQALIIPTMDVTDWGENQHRLHGRVAPIRSAEYRVPIFRLCSSGFSQLTDRDGRVLASAGFPGQEEIMGGTLSIGSAGRLPFDALPAPLATLATLLFAAWCAVQSWKSRRVATTSSSPAQ